MKRFLIFIGAQYYPSEGMGDFIYDTNSLDEIKDITLDYYKGQFQRLEGITQDSFEVFLKDRKRYDYITVYDSVDKKNVIEDFSQIEGL